MIFLLILFSSNHTKTYTLLFYSFLILIDVNRLVYSKLFVFFSFAWLMNFQKKNLFCHSLVLTPNYFFLISLCFLKFPIIFPKTTFQKLLKLFIKLKKSFWNYFLHFFSSVFISMYDFSWTFWLNLITLCTFSKLIPDIILF